MKYWAYINNEIKGPFEPDELIKIDGFSPSTLVCPQSSVEEETKEWKEAREIPELAVFSSSKLPTENKEDGDLKTSELQQTQKKEEIIIERFGIENLFAPVTDIDIDKNRFSSTDPLTLSQIRKRVEINQKDIKNDEKEEIQHNIVEEPPKEYQSSIPTEMPKEIIEEFQIPSTDELLKSVEKPLQQPELENDEQLMKEFEYKEKEETEKFVEETKQVQNTSSIDETELNKKLDDKFYQFREIILNEINKIFDERLEIIKKEFSEILQTAQDKNNFNVDAQSLKNEILAEIELKISSISQNQQPASLNISEESFKKEFEELKNLTRHLEIEIRDLRTRTESIENKIKTEPVGLSRENLPKQDQSKSNQTSDNELSKEPKKSQKSNALKIILTIILIPVALGSILFMLKQFGVFDFTSLFNSKNKKQETAQTIQQEHSTILQDSTPYISTQDQSPLQASTNTETYTQQTQPVSQETQNTQMKNEDKKDIPLESIINEVKDYKIKSPYNLEKTITSILKSRKADLLSVKWEAQKKDEENKYLIIVNAKASKPIEFRFEFDFKTKLLQPLNTLSINTLKMMMEETKENKKTAKTTQTKPTQKQSNKKIVPNQEKKSKLETKSPNLNDQTDEDGQVFIDETKSQNTEEESDGDYLIIGE